jgi:UDP-N-acetyl-D-mannosaminuronic acid dehydrogenase
MVDVVVAGCGGVGLPLAVAFARRGVRVLGFDIDRARIRALAEGHIEIEDEGLTEALRLALTAGALSFSGNLDFVSDLTPATRAFIITVPTPIDEHKRFVSAPLHAAVRNVLRVAHRGDLIIVRSTTPVGTLRYLAGFEEAKDRELLFAACPDRTIAGRAFAEQFSTPHIVGGLTPAASEAARRLFARLGDVEVVSSPEVAEAAKLFANVWRDAQFALSNQLALFCETKGIDFSEVCAAGGRNFARFKPPRAGPVGGPCLTKDVYLLAEGTHENDVGLLKAARAFNEGLVDIVAHRICARADKHGAHSIVAILGLAFKGNPPTLDRRGSFALALAAALRTLRPGLELRLWDPACEPSTTARTAALHDANIVVLANDHAGLRDVGALRGCAAHAVVFDLCGVLADGEATAGLMIERFGQGRSVER